MICLAVLNSNTSLQPEGEFIICKSKKSFDNAYHKFINNQEIERLNIACPRPAVLFKHFKKKFKIIKAAGGAVINANSDLLIIKRNGLWDLPKGKIEKGETKKVAAIREVQEECGIQEIYITSRIGKTYHTYQLKGEEILKITYWYKMSYTGNKNPKPQLEEDITEAKWISKNEIPNVMENTYKNLLEVFKEIQSY